MRLDSVKLEASAIRQRFDAIASTFDKADFVHEKTRAGLLERLKPIKIDGGLILDLGSATGKGSKELHKVYRSATIISFDISSEMLKKVLRKRPLFSRYNPLAVQGDASRIPIQDKCVDLVFCNQMLPWVDNLSNLFSEIERILKPNGVFSFATLGPETFSGLYTIEKRSKAFLYPDMHDVGDALVQAGLSDPVLDIDRLKVTFPSLAALVADLEACGASRHLSARQLELQATHCKPIEMDFELVYGHAWGTKKRLQNDEYQIDPKSITQRTTTFK